MIRPSLALLLLAASTTVIVPVTIAAPSAAGPVRERVLATVNGDPITKKDLEADLVGAASADPARVLDRRINVVLVLQEAERMGLRDTLEVRDQVGIFERDTLRDGLFATRVATMKADPKDVERLEREMTTEVRMFAVLLPKESDAKALVDDSARGKDLEAAARALESQGKAKVNPGEGYIKLAELRPEVQTAIAPLKPGQNSPAYPIDAQFAVTRLLDRRTVKDASSREKAEDESLKRRQFATITAFVEELKKKYAKIDERLLAATDFDAKEAGFEGFLKDERPIVAIAGEAPIKISDIAGSMRKRLFHGTGAKASQGRLNRRKSDVLDDLIAKRVVMKEAVRLGLDKKPEYLTVRREYEDQVIFGIFVAKVIEPEVKVSDEDIQQYYRDHLKEFTAPDMARLDLLAFDGRKTAEQALAKLRTGADLGWIRANAPGRVDASRVADPLELPAGPVMISELPQGLRDALVGSRSGDYRLYVSPQGSAFVVVVREFITGRPQELEDVKHTIQAKLTGERRQKAFDEYTATLRKASEVEILVGPEELKALLGASASKS